MNIIFDIINLILGIFFFFFFPFSLFGILSKMKALKLHREITMKYCSLNLMLVELIRQKIIFDPLTVFAHYRFLQCKFEHHFTWFSTRNFVVSVDKPHVTCPSVPVRNHHHQEIQSKLIAKSVTSPPQINVLKTFLQKSNRM